MNAFVTGSTGLLGNNLIRLLVAQGHSVRALARSPEKARQILNGLPVEIVTGDMQAVDRFTDALKGSDVLFHTAAYFREYYQPGEHWPLLKAINVRATLELLEAADKHGVKRAIFVSTGGLIGKKASGEPGDETTPPAPIARNNLYFRSKLLAEEAIREFLKEHRLQVSFILPGWIFGPYDAAPTSSGQLVLDYLNRKLPGSFPGGSSIVDVRDVAQAMISAVEHGQNGERYIIGGRYVSLEALSGMLEKVTGIPAPTLRVPYPAALAISWASETIARLRREPTLLTVDGVRTMHAGLEVNSGKAIRELGVSFRPLEVTIKDEIDWFQKSLQGGLN